MNGSLCFAATKRFFKFENGTVVFSCMILSQAITETERRRLILAGIARIDSIENDEKEPYESSAFYRDLAKGTFDATQWETPLVPVIVCAHQELCPLCEYEYVKCICRRITTTYNLCSGYGIIDVPRVLFHCMEGIIQMQSRVTPLSYMTN